MIRLLNTLFPKSLIVAAAGAGMFVSTIGDASACDGKRGGFYRPTYRPAYPTQQYCQKPVQPYMQQPLVGQQFQQQPQFQQQQVPPQVQQWMPQGQQVQGQQTVQGQPTIQQGQPAIQQGQQFQQGVAQQGVAQQGVAQQGVAQQQVQSSGFATQNTGVAAPIGGASTAQANVSAIGALGGSAPAAAGVQSQNLAAAPAQANVAAPGGDSAVNGSAVNGSAVASAPADSTPIGGNTANNNTAPAPSAEQNAMESALQALMGDAAPAAQPVSAAPAAAPVGEFSATLTNGTTIRLSLRADGSFNWVASKGDKVSSFQGTFNFTGSSLALNRSNDRQKLEGSLALTAAGFKLQLSGQNAEGLNFVRA